MTDDLGHRTDDNPFASNDHWNQHLTRALELVEHETYSDGDIDMRAMYDAVAHLRLAAVEDIMTDD